MAELDESIFKRVCRNKLEDILKKYEFHFVNSYSRPRGYVVEFARNSDSVFAVNEGNSVSIELIRHLTSGTCYRVDLNQLLWFNGFRAVIGVNEWNLQLAKLAEGLSTFADDVLNIGEAAIDTRYWHQISEKPLGQFLAHQRGR